MFLAKQLSVSKMAFLNKIFDIKTWITSPRSVMQHLFTSAAKHDHFLLAPDKLTAGDILAMDRAYIDYEKFEQMTQRGVIYVTKMKQNLTYETLSSTYYMNREGADAVA